MASGASCVKALVPLHSKSGLSYPCASGLAVATTSKTFDPKTFLSTVHPNASFSDLKVGGERLKGAPSFHPAPSCPHL